MSQTPRPPLIALHAHLKSVCTYIICEDLTYYMYVSSTGLAH